MDNQSISGATVSSSRIPPSGLPGHPGAPPASPLAAGAMGHQILAAQGPTGTPQINPMSHVPPGYGHPSHGFYPPGMPPQVYMPPYPQYPYANSGGMMSAPYSSHMGAPTAPDTLPHHLVPNLPQVLSDTSPFTPTQGFPSTPAFSPAVPHIASPPVQNSQNAGLGQQVGVNDASILEAPIWCFQCQQWHPSKQSQEQIHSTIQTQPGYNPGIMQSQNHRSTPPEDFFNTRMNQAIRDAVAAQLASMDCPPRQGYYNRDLEERKQRLHSRISGRRRHDDRYRAVSPGRGRDYEETRTATPSDARAWHNAYTDDDPDDIRAETATNVSAGFSDMTMEDDDSQNRRGAFPKHHHRQGTPGSEPSEEDTNLPLKYLPSQYPTQYPMQHLSRPRPRLGKDEYTTKRDMNQKNLQEDAAKTMRNTKQEASDSEVSYKPRRARKNERAPTQQVLDANDANYPSHKPRESRIRVGRILSGSLSTPSSNAPPPESPEIELYEAILSFSEWYAKNYGIDEHYITKLRDTLNHSLQIPPPNSHEGDKNMSKQSTAPHSPRIPIENTKDYDTSSSEVLIDNNLEPNRKYKGYQTKETAKGDLKKRGSNNVKHEATASVRKGKNPIKELTEPLEAKIATQKMSGRRARPLVQPTAPGSPVKQMVPERTRRQYSLVLDEYSHSLTSTKLGAPKSTIESKATTQIPVAAESTMGSLGLDYLMTKPTVECIDERQQRDTNNNSQSSTTSQQPLYKATVETVIDDYDNAVRPSKSLGTGAGQRYTNTSLAKAQKYADAMCTIQEEQKRHEPNISQNGLRTSPMEFQPEYTSSEIKAADHAGSSDGNTGEYMSAADEQEWEEEEEEPIDEYDLDQDSASEEASDTDEILLELLSDGRYSDVISGMFSDADTEAMSGVTGAYGGDGYLQDENMAARLRSRLNEFERRRM